MVSYLEKKIEMQLSYFQLDSRWRTPSIRYYCGVPFFSSNLCYWATSFYLSPFPYPMKAPSGPGDSHSNSIESGDSPGLRDGGRRPGFFRVGWPGHKQRNGRRHGGTAAVPGGGSAGDHESRWEGRPVRVLRLRRLPRRNSSPLRWVPRPALLYDGALQ